MEEGERKKKGEGKEEGREERDQGGGLVVDFAEEGEADGFGDGVCFFQDFVVPESDDGEALGLEPVGATVVVGLLLGVLGAIDFYDEFGVVGDEVNDVGADGGLSSEFHAVDLALADVVPESAFGVGGVFSELAGVGGVGHGGRV